MPRPRCRRRVAGTPVAAAYKPAGVPMVDLEQVRLTLDELEALRLADMEGLYQADAAERMGVSRPTFGRIVGNARQKVACALVGGKALLIEGGAVEMTAPGRCARCQQPDETCTCPHCAESDPPVS